MNLRRIDTANASLEARLSAAPSKSVTHRALVSAALAEGTSAIRRPLVADDTVVTRNALQALGIPIRVDGDIWRVEGCGGRVPGGGDFDLMESGTSLRFLLAVAALGETESRLDGAPRLRERPVSDLAEALGQLGARIELTPGGGGLPARVVGGALGGGSLLVPGDRSSQFASGLLLIGPCLGGTLDVQLEPPVVSLPYIELTAQVMQVFGAQIRRTGECGWRTTPGIGRGTDYVVEGDHSSASYFLAAPAVVGGRVRVERIAPTSLQPDACLGDVLERVGCAVHRGPDWVEVEGTGKIEPFELDMGHAPDVVPTLAVMALFADGPSEIRGVAHLRHKESDRLAVLARNLTALGRPTTVDEDRLVVGAPAGPLRGARIATASDHRMAMAFAIAGLRIPGIEIDDADCVAKSNPDFWTQHSVLTGGAGA
ncbi:MAG: 3-phosphoshikimate 1-carboxyvinyltransferase [bacterium]|nr:3-phosphoshikimate 1-carboxyvinyltransferase [bacterium]